MSARRMRQRTIDNSVSSLLKILFHMGDFSNQFRWRIVRCLEPQRISNIFVCKELHETNVVWFQAPRDEWLDNTHVQQFFTANLIKLTHRCGVITVLNFSKCNNLTNKSVLLFTCHCAQCTDDFKILANLLFIAQKMALSRLVQCCNQFKQGKFSYPKYK